MNPPGAQRPGVLLWPRRAAALLELVLYVDRRGVHIPGNMGMFEGEG